MKDFFKFNLNTVILIAILFFQFADCGNNPNESTGTKSETVHRYDTTIHLVHTHNTTHTKELIPKIPEKVDTPQALTDFYTPVIYRDSIKSDSLEGEYSGVIWKNEMFAPSLKYRFTFPTQTTTTIISPKTNKVHFGAFLGYSTAPFVGGMVGYQDKRDRQFLAGYGANQTGFVGMTWKIRLRR